MDDKAHYLKTKSILSTMVSGAAGWEAKIGDPQVNAGPLSHLYVFDLPTKWVWMCAVARDAFVKMSEIGSRQNQADRNAVRDGLATIISSISEGKPPSDIDGMDWEYQLGSLLATYAGSTQTFASADGLRNGGHFIVLNYRAMNNPDGLLRPFAMPGTDNQIIPVDQLNAAIDHVIALDRKKHPEWFKGK